MSIKKHSLLMIGDSLVEWGDWEGLLPGYDIVNRGRAGETVEEMAGRIFAEIDSQKDCGYVLIMSGTNNILMGDTLFPMIFSTMLPRLQMLVPDTTIILNSLFPMPAAPCRDIMQVNEELAMICKQAHCIFMDAGPEFTALCRPITHPCFHPDGVHLTGHGYRTWARVIRQHLPGPSSSDEG